MLLEDKFLYARVLETDGRISTELTFAGAALMLIGKLIAGLHCEQYIVILGIGGMGVMAVLRGDKGNAGLLRKFYEQRFDLFAVLTYFGIRV